jgi:hypothetical protein
MGCRMHAMNNDGCVAMREGCCRGLNNMSWVRTRHFLSRGADGSAFRARVHASAVHLLLFGSCPAIAGPRPTPRRGNEYIAQGWKDVHEYRDKVGLARDQLYVDPSDFPIESLTFEQVDELFNVVAEHMGGG